ncbi:MAG: hypothetical protein A2Z38_04510 [Planctomycetes bacterium RBG_19FT_COMBO_48_8]|nr:MAG: hypothetical protein A2Z38_04510 [Planctomycetes bacterium RBG_19FT_COMBO_48_8]
MTADNGTTITTPGFIVLARKTEHTLVAEYSGHENQQVKLEKKLNNWVWGNILIGGIIGIVIDMVSGSINQLNPKEVHFKFEGTSDSSATNIPILYQDMLFRRYNAYSLSRIYELAA